MTEFLCLSFSSDMTSEGREIPTRRVVITDPSLMPSTYSTTPGGTIFGTTPGGTRIVYDRAFLLQCRHSPAAQTPPNNLPKIPGVTCCAGEKANTNGEEENGLPRSEPRNRQELRGEKTNKGGKKRMLLVMFEVVTIKLHLLSKLIWFYILLAGECT